MHIDASRQLLRLLIVLCGLLAVTRTPAVAADYSDEAVKAAYLFRFAAYVDWPQHDPAKNEFIIAVLDAPGIARQLTSLAQTHLINNRRVEVRELQSVRDLRDPDILFVGAGQAASLHAWKPSSPAGSTLVVTDEEDGLKNGGMLNFLVIDHRVRFEVSLTAAAQAHLTISSELLAVAVRVFGVPKQSRELCTPRRVGESSQDCVVRVARRWDESRRASTERAA